MKNILKYLIITMCIFLLTSCGSKFNEVSEYVNSNYDNLEENISNYYSKGTNIDVDDYIKNVITSDDKIEFEISTGSKKIGFFYSLNDTPTSYQNTNYELVEYESNKYTWTSLNGESGKVIKIKNNFYYYEANV